MDKKDGQTTHEELLRYTWGALSLTGLERATSQGCISETITRIDLKI